VTQNRESEYYHVKERQGLKPLVDSGILTHGKSKAQKMKSKWLSIFVIIVLSMIMCFVMPARKVHAAACTFTSNGTGNWSAAIWTIVGAGCGAYPGQTFAGDTVIIATGNTVTLDVSPANAIGALTVNTQAAGGTNGLTVGANNLTAASIFLTGSGTAGRFSTVSISTGTLNVTGNFTFAGTAAQARLTFTSTGTLNIGGNLGTGGTFAASTGTVNCNGSAAQTVAGYTYNILKSNNTAGVTLVAATIITTLTIGDGTANSVFNDGGFVITPGAGSVLNLTSGTYNLGSATVGTTWPAWGTRNITAGTTVGYVSGVAQAVSITPSYPNLTFSGAGTKTPVAGTLTIGGNWSVDSTTPLNTNNTVVNLTGNLALTAGTLTQGTGAITIGGNWTNSSTFTAGSGGVTFNGVSAQTIGGTTATTFFNMTVNNAAGVSLSINTTVSNVLTLTNGDISTGANTLEVSSSCATPSISGGGATSYVFGNLILHYPAGGTTCTFPIGDATTYAPVTVAMVGVTSTLANSTLQARTDTPDHADTTSGTSGIDKNYSVNRYWTLTPGGSMTFTSYSPTFTFVAGDIDSGATPANFIIARKNVGVWSYPTMGTKTATTTQATGITQANGFGVFAVGEASGIYGTVFEDINYGGGAGRSLAGSSGAPVANVRVELYSNTGAYVTTATTNASGLYRFPQTSGTYTVRVSSNGATGIRSTRTGGAACTTCVPVQTYRTDATSGTAVDVTDHVGGETPTLMDAADNTTSATLASLTTATTTAQSITTVTKGTANITGVDFGFNFDTIVSIRDASQGSLRQFITNANALGGEGSLAQVGQTSGQETSIFMIPHHTAVPGQNTGYADQLTSGGANNGAAVITLTTGVLPTISGNNTSLDTTTQTANVGDTNSGTVGTGGTVGTMAQTLQPFNRPEVVISAAATQLTASGTTDIIKGLAIANGGITVNGNNSQVRDCLSGMNADGSVTTAYGGNFAVQCGAGTGILVSHNYTKVNNSSIRGDNPGANLIIEYNEVDSPNGTPGGGHTNTFDGILIVGTASNVTVRYNLVRNQRGGGLEYGFAGGTVISGTAIGNTISINGFASAGTRSAEPVGVVIWQLNAASALTMLQNVITGNAGPGLVVIAATNVTITQNSIFSNGSLATDIGIDLNTLSGDPNTYTAQGVTLNDMNDADTGPNNLLNFPIIDTAIISGSNLVLRGWARPGSVIEFFIAAPDASGFGSGKTYLTTLTEGSGADTDATSSTYGPGVINGIAQGTDTTNRYMFTIPTPGGVAVGTVLTATATLAGNTSEFSGNATVVGAPNIFILKSADKATASPGEVITYTIQVKNDGTGSANTVTLTDNLGNYNALAISPYAGSPFNFVDGSPASGLTLGTPTYSNDNGVTFTYTPLVSGAGGAPAGYDGVVTDWKIIMNNNMNPGGGNFTLNYKVIVK